MGLKYKKNLKNRRRPSLQDLNIAAHLISNKQILINSPIKIIMIRKPLKKKYFKKWGFLIKSRIYI
jgi:hypothetical protein